MSPTPTLRSPLVRCTAAIVAVTALSALAWFSQAGAQNTPPAPAAPVQTASGGFRVTEAQLQSLTIETVKTGAFDAVVTADGSVAVNDNATVSVYSQFSGRVTAIYGQPGQAVRKGTPLVAILSTEAAQTRSDLAAALAAEATARKQFEVAQLSERRQHELWLAEAGAEKDWQQSKADLAAAENTLQADVAALAAAREKAAVLGGAARQPMHADTADHAVITAPIDGIILQRQVAPGQFVSSLANGGSTALYTISDLQKVWVLGNVSEAEVQRIRVGQPVEISGVAIGGRSLRTKLAWIANTVDPVTHRVTLRAELENPDALLKPEMSVTFRVLESQPVQAISVPRSALVYDGQEVHCFVNSAGRMLVSHKLEIGRIQGDRAEVKSGLTVGDRVVTRGTLFIDRAAQDDNT